MATPAWSHAKAQWVVAMLALLVGSAMATEPYYYSSPPPPYEYKSPPPPVKSPPPPYEYKSPPPPIKSPPPYYYNSPPPPVKCYDWTHPKKSHDKKHLQGAVVEVTCKAGDKTVKAYGKTKNNGKYAITVKGYNYRKYGGDVCTAKLHAPPKGSPCNIPTDYHWGNKGAKLHVKSKTKDEVVLYAKSFAYAPKKPYGECHKPAPYHPPYYYKCYDWTHPKKSHDKKHLQGAVVEVTCKAGDKTVKAYGKTKNNGKYAITVKGYNYRKYGGDVCTAKLHAPPKGSPCNIPTDYHWGNKGAKLHVKSKTKDEVVLYAKSFAYAPKKPYGECHKPAPYHPPYYYKSPPPPTYVYKSPPPPTPTYIYKSPPPPTPTYVYKSPPPPTPTYVYKSPPPPTPTYVYKSPPPPTPTYVYKSPPLPTPTYVYKSPPPPTPTYVYKSPPPPTPTYVYKSPPPPTPTYVYKESLSLN
ncbi:PREDICTED: extensin-3-like [Camelina sativa]|uniref:Extensin-3-like n=1 Tax=Camelina sativa TaxID=90675 RepID=A0ABM0SLK4_CAMSA|nr:PREDICTED: extensin-3-like [Camelina sativa]